jgi:hypothetical protein
VEPAGPSPPSQARAQPEAPSCFPQGTRSRLGGCWARMAVEGRRKLPNFVKACASRLRRDGCRISVGTPHRRHVASYALRSISSAIGVAEYKRHPERFAGRIGKVSGSLARLRGFPDSERICSSFVDEIDEKSLLQWRGRRRRWSFWEVLGAAIGIWVAGPGVGVPAQAVCSGSTAAPVRRSSADGHRSSRPNFRDKSARNVDRICN